MMQNLRNNKTADAVIHLKDGKKKHGLLIDESPETGNYFFIPNNSIPILQKPIALNGSRLFRKH
jgi:hypothetical protein